MIPPLDRRTALRGLGLTLALPLLERMAPARDASRAAPRRAVFLYVPNGIHMPDWRPRGEGEALELGPTMEPLAPWRDALLVISGLTHDKARPHGDGPGDHARSAGSFLTGCHPKKTDGPIEAGISADQLAAREIGNATRLRSLELGCEPGRLGGQCDSGYSCAYSNTISWSAPHVPLPKETDPRLVFDRLFRDEASELPEALRDEHRRRRRSVLDFVRDDVKRLGRQLGAADQRKLDEYESGVRELERRIAFLEQRGREAGFQRPAELPDNYADLARLQADLLALAFETDSTRIATFLLANEGSGRSYPALGAPEGHHELTTAATPRSSARSPPSTAITSSCSRTSYRPSRARKATAPCSTRRSWPTAAASRTETATTTRTFRSCSPEAGTAMCAAGATCASRPRRPARTCGSPCSIVCTSRRLHSETRPGASRASPSGRALARLRRRIGRSSVARESGRASRRAGAIPADLESVEHGPTNACGVRTLPPCPTRAPNRSPSCAA